MRKLYLDNGSKQFKFADTTAEIHLNAFDDGIASSLANDAKVRIKNNSGYLLEVSATITDNHAVITSGQLAQLPTGGYLIELWDTVNGGTAIYPSDGFLALQINENATGLSGGLVSSITVDDFIQQFSDLSEQLKQQVTDAVANGLKGDTGADGLSAYQIAVINGYQGSQTEWLTSLVGPKGDTGVFQSADIADGSITSDKLAGENKLYSILPTKPEDWDSLKVVTTVGSKYSYNSMPTTVESSDQHYYTSMPNYGLYSRLMVAKGGSDVTLIGSTLRYVSLLEYDANLTMVAASEWKEARTLVTLNAATAYIVIAVKNKNNSVMTLSNVATLGVDVLSETLNGEFYTLPKPSFSEADWVQGFYNLAQGESIGDLTFSNYRLSTIVTVKPSTEYVVNFNKGIGNKKYQASIVLIDSDGTVINNSGWINTKDTVALRTSTSTMGVCVTVASRNAADNEDVIIRPTDASLIALKVGNHELFGNGGDINSSSWKQGNIGLTSGEPIIIGEDTRRIYNCVQLKKNTTYLINMNAAIEYRFNFAQATSENIGLYDSYWRWGEYRLQTNDTDEYLYIVASLKNDADLAVDAAINFKPKLTEISPLNSKLDTITTNKMIMHRGASQVAPEDTIPAIIEAARASKWATEMDVQYTSDGVAVIMHDATIDRTTTGTGAVSELTLEEIKAATVDFGANIDKYPDLKVPTLEESIIACKRYGIIPVLDCGAILQDNDLVQKLVFELQRLGIEQRCIVLSQGTNDACNFRYFNQITPLIVQYNGNIDSELEARRLYGYRESYLGGWNFDQTGTTDEMLMSFWSECHKLQLQVYAITNDRNEAERFLDNGCDYISSDDLSILQY